ncbi:MAG: tripartite tricarboxylate transporter TctB family protein [Castellaniella sp.]|uniref:tripartite tricarboxylate transporter TctB family protein n=1 Tax=Castellaniella sp. TaxID=1955812 RepID=UPI003C71D247
MALNTNPSGKQADLGFAAILLVVAVWVIARTSDYPGASGTYPRVLAILLAIGAALVIVRRLRTAEQADEPRLFLHAGRFALGLAAIIAYVAAISLVGYLLPSLAIGVVLPWCLGYRKISLSLSVTLGTIVFIVLVFYTILGRPMPPDLLNPILEMVR